MKKLKIFLKLFFSLFAIILLTYLGIVAWFFYQVNVPSNAIKPVLNYYSLTHFSPLLENAYFTNKSDTYYLLYVEGEGLTFDIPPAIYIYIN